MAKRRRRSPPPGVSHCRPCKKKFRSPENLALHNDTQHSETVEKILCNYWPRCEDGKHKTGLYSTSSNLRVHLQKHHDIQSAARRNRLASRAQRIYCRRTRKEWEKINHDNHILTILTIFSFRPSIRKRRKRCWSRRVFIRWFRWKYNDWWRRKWW